MNAFLEDVRYALRQSGIYSSSGADAGIGHLLQRGDLCICRFKGGPSLRVKDLAQQEGGE